MAASHILMRSSICAHSFAAARSSLDRWSSMARTKFQSEARTVAGIQPIFSARRAADTAFARLSDWFACAIARSLDSKTARGPSPGCILSIVASRLMWRRYPSSVSRCHPLSVVEAKVVPYPSSSALWSSSRAVAHCQSRGGCPAVGDQAWSWASSCTLRSHFCRPLHPNFSRSNHRWCPPQSGRALLGGPSQHTQSPDFLLLKWRFPSIHLNSGWGAPFCPPRSFCRRVERPDELELPDDEDPESLSLLLLSDENEVDSGDPRLPFPRLDDFRPFFSFRRSFLRCFFSLYFCFFLCSSIFAFRASFPHLSQSNRIFHNSYTTAPMSASASVSSASMRSSSSLHIFWVQRGAPGLFRSHRAFL